MLNINAVTEPDWVDCFYSSAYYQSGNTRMHYT